MIREREYAALPGLPITLLLLVTFGLLIYTFVNLDDPSLVTVVGLSLALVLNAFLFAGVFSVNPNEGRVLQLFGEYVGTVKKPGLRWANPLFTKKRISLRVRNFESTRLKVNDHEGNPIEIASVVVWRVVDTAEAVFEVDD